MLKYLDIQRFIAKKENKLVFYDTLYNQNGIFYILIFNFKIINDYSEKQSNNTVFLLLSLWYNISNRELLH